MARPKKAKKDKLTGIQQRRYFLQKSREVRNTTKVKFEQMLDKIKIKHVDMDIDLYGLDHKEFADLVARIRNPDYEVCQDWNDDAEDEGESQSGFLVHKDDVQKLLKRQELQRRKFKFLKSSDDEIDRMETSLVFTTAEDAEKLLNDFRTFCKTWLEQP